MGSTIETISSSESESDESGNDSSEKAVKRKVNGNALNRIGMFLYMCYGCVSIGWEIASVAFSSFSSFFSFSYSLIPVSYTHLTLPTKRIV